MLFAAMGPLKAYAGSTASAYESNSNYLILGVIASSENKAGVALIKNVVNGKTFAVREGKNLSENTKLSKVFRKHVEMTIAEKTYLIKVGDFTADAVKSGANSGAINIAEGIQSDGDTIKVSSSLKDHIVNEKLNTVLMQAAAVPYYMDGALAGFTLWDIEKDSIYEKFGFQDGDTVTSINEQEITDVGRTIKLLNTLRNENNASVTYLRNGRARTVRIEIQ